MNIVTLDTKTANIIIREMVKALQPVAKRYNVKIMPHGGTIGPSHLDVITKFKVEVIDTDAKAEARRNEFDTYCELFGLKPEHFGARFTSRGTEYTISGLELKRRKYPIRATGPDGKELLFTESVAKHLGR